MFKEKKNLFIIAAVIAGFLVGIGYGQVRLQSQKSMYSAKLKDLNQRLTQTQRTISKDLTLQNALEEEKQQALAETEKLAKEKATLSAQGKALKEKADLLEASKVSLERKTASLELENRQHRESLTKAETDRENQEKKLKQTTQTLSEREKELGRLQAKYNQCAEHNARLYFIGEELIDRYRKKGVMGSILEKEPFTQIKKVELENLVQEYKDQIDRQAIRSK